MEDRVDAVNPAVSSKARVHGATDWLAALPGLIDEISRDWGLRIGATFADSTEAHVLEATRADGEPCVLKLIVPRDGEAARHEIAVLRLADGQGCVRLLEHDEARSALLLERLGPSMHEQGLPLLRRQELLCDAAQHLWRPAPGLGLPTGAEKGRWLVDFIARTWQELDRPCSERTMDHALACAERRIAAHDDERAVLVHGDIHEWNALRAGAGFKLVDPDGLLAEPEYDLGILMREDPEDLLHGGDRERAAWLADRTGCEARAIWEWGVVERVSTGLLLTSIDMADLGGQMLAVAERVAREATR